MMVMTHCVIDTYLMMVMRMMMMTQTCRSLRTSMSLTGRQTAVLQNITCVFSKSSP